MAIGSYGDFEQKVIRVEIAGRRKNVFNRIRLVVLYIEEEVLVSISYFDRVLVSLSPQPPEPLASSLQLPFCKFC